MNWSDYPNFSKDEFDCKHTGRNKMDPDFVARLQALRTAFGRPIIVTSGYRDPTHPIEARKARPGAHASGRAADIGARAGATVHEIIRLAMLLGFTGIGVSQRNGRPRFVHLDTLEGSNRPAVWSY